MRVHRQLSLTVTEGRVAILDPGLAFPPTSGPPYFALPSRHAVFDDFGGDGTFKVYRSGDVVIVDTAPRQFKANVRDDFTRLSGEVAVDTGTIAFVNASDLPASAASAAGGVLCDLPRGDYVVWSEQKDESASRRRFVLGLGPSVRLTLAGPDAMRVREIERQLSEALRLKGAEKAKALAAVQSELVALRLAGSRDRRLRRLADAAGVRLPPRPRGG